MKKVQQIKLILKGTAQINARVYFAPDPVINMAILKGISMPKVGTDISANFYDNGATPLPDANFADFFITLCNYKGEEVHKNLIPYTLQPTNNNGIIRNDFYNNIDLSKSYVTFTKQVVTNNTFVLFNFHLKTPDRK